ncbi:MAG: hypothetical protein APF84_07055 [Gracilibacter sp. BRH_c7a]|nr:MAG: hypothetical protein APF84_07055 [Gracilibacter sp. BRH_c7a]
MTDNNLSYTDLLANMLNSLIQIERLSDYQESGIKKRFIRGYDIYYQILLGLVSQGIIKSEKMMGIFEFLDNIDSDLEKIILIKNTLSEFSLDNYKNISKSSNRIMSLIKAIDSDINKFYLLKNSIQGLKFNYYKNTIRSLGILSRK